MRTSTRSWIPALFTAALGLVAFPQAQAAGSKVPVGKPAPAGFQRFYPDREKPAALIDHPLRQPSICRGPDDWFYLTGTDGTPSAADVTSPDFANNDGIRLWRSRDLQTWEPLGKVFDITPASPAYQKAWWREPVVDDSAATPTGLASRPLVRGVYAPELHHLNNTWWLVFSLGRDGGVGLLKSTSGKPEGPYADHAHLAATGGSPSLFEDAGRVYLLWGRGLVAPLTDDLSGLAEEPRQLLCAADERSPGYPLTVGQRGFQLFKHDNKYWLCAEQLSFRDQYAGSDVFVASSDSLLGPYSARRWMIPHAGETTVFRGPGDKLFATYSGNDEESALTARAGVVPLSYSPEPARGRRDSAPIPRIAAGVHTERGAWDELYPVTRYGMRDVTCVRAPDGYYYYSGSWTDAHFAGRLALLRSRDLVNWEELTVLTLDDLPWLTAESRDLRKKLGAANPRTLDDKFMDTELHWVKGTFYYIYSLYSLKDLKAGKGDLPPGKAHNGTYYMRSTSGKIEGPWEHLGLYGSSQGSLFEDGDGTVYALFARTGLGKMKPDMTGGMEKFPAPVVPADGSHPFTDVGAYLRKINNRYVYFSCGVGYSAHEPISVPGDDSIATYNYSYVTAPTPTGPWSSARMAVDYGGHGGIFQDDQGRWWAAFFGGDGNGDFQRHWWGPPGIAPLEVSERDGELVIRVADKLPADYAAALAKKRAAEQARAAKP